MRHDFTLERRVILFGVVALAAADIALVVYGWNRRPQQDLAVITRNRDLLRADITRAQDIRQRMPAIQKDCDQFEQSLYPASSGYSSVRSELGATAKKNGIRLDDFTSKETKIANRGITEVAIDATVDGDYKSVVGFLNGLQRSSNLYQVDSLSLATENANLVSPNVIKVALHLKTYFRTGA